MARLDFGCPTVGCPSQVLDRVAPGGTPPPLCTVHQVPMEVVWDFSPAVDFIDPIEFEHDGGRKETITSLHRVREIERLTADAEAKGEGRPVVFRQYSQGRSNLDRNVFQALHPQVAREKLLRKRRGKPIISVGGVDISVHGDPGDPGGSGGREE